MGIQAQPLILETLQYLLLYHGRVLVAMVPFDVPRELYAHNIRLDNVYINGFDSYFRKVG